MSKEVKLPVGPGASFLNAARLKCEAQISEAYAKIGLYLENPVGIGDHPDIMAEILKAAADGAHARDIINFLDSYDRNS